MTDQPSPKFGGVDWATDDHAICIVDSTGGVHGEFAVDHTAAGLRKLCRRLIDNEVERVAIERPDGPVVDALMEAGLDVVVVVSRSVKAFRERYATSGSKSDRGDAYVLADCLRSDGHRWPSLQPDTPSTITLRAHVRARQDLVATRVAAANRLRAHLQINFPGAVGLFSDLDGHVSRQFTRRFTTENDSAWLTEKRFANWLRSSGYNNKRPAAELFDHLQRAAKGPSGPDAAARSTVAIAYLDVIETLVEQIKRLESRMAELLDAHPDAAAKQPSAD